MLYTETNNNIYVYMFMLLMMNVDGWMHAWSLISSCYIDRIDFESRLTVSDFKSLLR